MAVPVVMYSHHGRKYLVTSSQQIAEPGSFYGLFTSYLQSRLGERVSVVEPGILFGLSRRWDMELHAHHTLEHGHFHTEAVGFESRFGIFGNFSEEEVDGDLESSPIGVAVVVEFEKGLHEHDDVFEGRLVIGGITSSLPVAANLIWEKSFGDEVSNQWRYAVGIRKNITRLIDIGLEFQGNFEGFLDSRVTPGVYISATENLDLKLGASLSFNSSTSGQTLHIALVYGL